MSKTKKVVIVFSCILLACIIGAGITLGVYISAGNSISDFACVFGLYRLSVDEEEQLDLDGISQISIECASADIHIAEADKAKVMLKGTVISPEQQQAYLKVSENDGTLGIKIEYDSFLFNISDFDLTVYLPADGTIDASVDCTSGNIYVAGMHFKNMSVSGTSGNMQITDCTAQSAEFETTSGDTTVDSCSFENADFTCKSGNTTIRETSGALKLRTTSGDINISEADGALDIGCTSGNITADMADISPVTAAVTSGNIKLYVSRDASFDITAAATSGSVTCDLDMTFFGSYERDSLAGTHGGGGDLINLTAVSGDISIIGK